MVSENIEKAAFHKFTAKKCKTIDPERIKTIRPLI